MEKKYNFTISENHVESIKKRIYELDSAISQGFSSELFNSIFQSYNRYPFSPKAAKLYQVEIRLGLSRDKIIELLGDAGYDIPDKPYYDLTYNHLTLLAKRLEKTYRKLFKRTKKIIRSLDVDSQDEYAQLFRGFIEDADKFNSVEIFEQEFNSELFEKWVIKRVVFDFEENEFDDTVCHFLRNLKFRLRKLFRDLRVQLLSIILSHHYHVFPNEEDSSRKRKTAMSFLDDLTSYISKVKNDFNYIQNFNKNGETNFNKKYKTMQFIQSG